MKKSIVLAVVLVTYSGIQAGYSLSDIKSSLKRGFQYAKDKAAQMGLINPFDSKVMVYNIADSYTITIHGVNIVPRTVQWVSAKRKGGTFTITARDKTSGKPAGQSVTYTRLPTEDVLEVDVGRAPAFPRITDRATERILAPKQSWKTGTVSATVKIWTRALSLVQAQNGYNITY